ncbi:MAG: sulfotransferase [Actinomycetota bacterium]|nr:sulfotransferase [Actinomycetota bacterium]
MTSEGERGEVETPIFVVGAMRSGTTLMRLVLDSHENIGIAPETGIMRVVRANKFVPFWMWGGEWYGRLGLSEEELDRELGAFYGRLLRRYADAHGKRRWGEKTPWHAWHLDEMARLWPDAVFVATVRHPGGNVDSLVSRWHMPLERAIAHWKNVNRQLVAHSEHLGERLFVCRYEDLVLAAEPTLRELLERLGEPWSSRVLEHDVVHRERGTAGRVEGRTRSTDAIDASRATAWLDHVRGDVRERLETETGTMAAFFGYSFANPSALEPLPLAPGRRVATGSDLAKRRARFADVPGLREPPVVPAIERPLHPDDVRLRRKDRERKPEPTAGERARERRAPGPPSAPPLLARVARRLRRLTARVARRLRRLTARSS